MKFVVRLLFAVPLLFMLSCESENWNLVDPPAGRDSVMVRYLNFCGDGAARTLYMDGVAFSQNTPDLAVSDLVAASADSGYVSVRGAGSEALNVVSRMHFAKQSNALIISMSSVFGAPKYRSLDTLLQFSTQRNINMASGYSAVRLLVCADDSAVANYEMRVGCPNGTKLGTPTAVRQGTAYVSIPRGDFVVSLLRNQDVVGVYKLSVQQGGYYSLIVATIKGRSVVRMLDELNPSNAALTTPPSVQQADRQAFVRCVNYSSQEVDSVSSSDGTLVSSKLGASGIGSYTLLGTCLSDQSDEFRLYSGGKAQGSISTSLGVLSKYTIICYDSNNVAASAMVIVPPTVTQTPADSVTVRIVNALNSSRNVHVRMGARSDANGSFRNGEVLAGSTPFGSVSKALRLRAGYAPITVLSDSSNDPEGLLGCFITTLSAGKEYVFIVGKSASGSVTLSQLESTEENSTLKTLANGVLLQIVNAREDRQSSPCSVNGVFNSTSLSFGTVLSTVCPSTAATVNAGYATKAINPDSSRRYTLILSGNAANPKLVSIDSASMSPQLRQARSRFINVTQDISPLLLGVVDSSATPLFYRTYIDNLFFGVATPTRAETNPTRVNFVLVDQNSNNVVYRPDYPLTFGIGKAYTLIVCGSATGGYSLILQQEY